ncbi:hypothetical protein RRG08_013833 [Elysia crispata]|uniref:Beta-lactamase-related domain-containing protein n=1 Tax=Elysia crispata TaxID=231223 RepID=A0AAE1EDX8_9GAST|nr:hypothetical protein RRG08_013833 [Elysia crispata]
MRYVNLPNQAHSFDVSQTVQAFHIQSPSKVLPSYAASNLWRKPAVKKSCEEDGSISHLKEFFAFENSTDSFSQEKVNSDSRNVETLAKSLTFVCAAVILLYLSKDYKYPIGIKVSQCTTTSSENSASKIDNNHVKGVDFRRGKLPTKHCFPRDGKDSISLEEAISKSQIICKRKKEELGSPGLVVCVSVDGCQVYAEGFGYADLENEVPIQPDSVMRVASISKSITAVIVAKLWENGKIDLDEKVQRYVPGFPQKYYMGEKVDITVSQLLSHTSGIRHYKKEDDPAYSFDEQVVQMVKKTREACLLPFYTVGTIGKRTQLLRHDFEPKMPFDELQNRKDNERYNKEYFPTTTKSLELFQNDPLLCKPGSRYVYSVHGFSLLAAIVESAVNRPFTRVVMKTFQSMGMKESYLDRPGPIINKRARHYLKDELGRVVNAPYVDDSYRWAGGGLLSTTQDLIKFGNILLYSAQHQEGDPGPPGYLKASTVWKLWSPPGGKRAATSYHGLGFELTPGQEEFGMGGRNTFGAGHRGYAIGASCMLFILPRYTQDGEIDSNDSPDQNDSAEKGLQDESVTVKGGVTLPIKENNFPKGVIVAVIVNLPVTDLRDIAKEIATTFEKVDFSLM